MKKIKRYSLSILLIAVMITSVGCGNNTTESKTGSNNNVQAALDSQIAKENSEEMTAELTTEASENLTTEQSDAEALKGMLEEQLASGSSEDESSPSDAKADPNVDVDLTVMNSDMIYATVYQMMADSDSYVGKKIKLSGTYYASWYEDTKQYYHYVLIKDALACCQQGLEFVWGDGSHVYPDEYPAEDAEVEVVGTFETYKDNPDDEYQFCHLVDATLVVKDAATGNDKN